MAVSTTELRATASGCGPTIRGDGDTVAVDTARNLYVAPDDGAAVQPVSYAVGAH